MDSKLEILRPFVEGLASCSKEDSQLFFVVPQCVNANVTARIFGYVFTSKQAIARLAKLSRAARAYVRKHWNGAIVVETLEMVTRESPHVTEDHSKF